MLLEIRMDVDVDPYVEMLDYLISRTIMFASLKLPQKDSLRSTRNGRLLIRLIL
jgi:hypothetical protein